MAMKNLERNDNHISEACHGIVTPFLSDLA
jgi:hypothetical protein